MLKKRFSIFSLLFMSGFVFLMGGCAKKVQTRDALNINLQTEPPTLDWSLAADTTSSLVIDNIMDGMTTYDMGDPKLKVVPEVAESWNVSEDGKTYTFKIRKEATWSDGQKVKAADFVYAWKRLLDPKTGSRYAYFLFPIKNAQAFNSGKIKDFSKVGVVSKDGSSLVVTLEKPISYFPTLLTHTSTFPMRQDVVEKHGDKWIEPANIVTNGPFLLETWQHDYKLTLVRNDQYWGPKAKLKNIVGYMVSEESSALNLYETGKLDLLTTIPLPDLPRLKQSPEYVKTTILAGFYYGINVNKPPFDNPNLRKAFSAAVTRQEVCDTLKGGQIPLTSWIPQGMIGYRPEIGIKSDSNLALKYLKEAGYEKGDKRLQGITLMFNTSEAHQQIAELLQAQWQKNLGLKVELINQEWKVYLETLNRLPKSPKKGPHLFRMGWVGDYPDPDNFMNLFTSYSENNHTGWKNPKFDQLIETAAAERDSAKREALYDEAQRLLTEQDVPIIPIYIYVVQKLVKPYVKGYKLNPLDKYELDKVWVEAGL